MAEVLRSNGYHTVAFTNNPFIISAYGFHQGFDKLDAIESIDGDAVSRSFVNWIEKRDKSRPYFAYLHYMDVHEPYHPLHGYREEMLGRYKRIPSKPLDETEYKKFLNKMRADYYVTRDLKDYLAIYDAQILYWDDLFANLWHYMSRRGHTDNLLVVFTADHGEGFLDHG